MLAGFLGRRGWELLNFRPVQSVYWPGRSCLVRYRLRAQAPNGNQRALSISAFAGNRPSSILAPPPDFGSRFGLEQPVERTDHSMIWAYPYDPVLAALPDAAHGPTLRVASGRPAPAVFTVTPVSYRPRKRAVFRYTVRGAKGARETLFGKVMRQDATHRAFDAYRNLAPTRIRLASPARFEGLDGLTLFPPLQGRSLRDLLVDGARVPSPRRLVDLMLRVAAVRWRGEGKPRDHVRSARSTGRVLAHLLPHRGAEISDATDMLAEEAGRLIAVTPLHGDLYDAQVFVDERGSLGLIDLEDAGPGDLLLDAANLLAHLAALSASSPQAARRPLAYRSLLRTYLLNGSGIPEHELAWREALCMLRLATGPFRVLSADWPRQTEARVDAALRYLRRAASASAA